MMDLLEERGPLFSFELRKLIPGYSDLYRTLREKGFPINRTKITSSTSCGIFHKKRKICIRKPTIYYMTHHRKGAFNNKNTL